MKFINKYFRLYCCDKWHFPKYYNNQYKELDFGKFSLFFGKGKNKQVLINN